MKRNNIILLTITILTLLGLVVFATYAYFANNATITNVTNLNVVSERNNMVFDTLGGGMILNVTASNMSEANNNTVAAENNTTLTVNFQANTSYSMVCTYDIVYEWTSNDKYQSHTSGVTQNEFTIQANLTNNAHVSQGNNHIASEIDFTTAVGNQNSATVVSGAQIDSTGTSTSTAVWTITSKFYNVNANQNTLADKTYEGRFKVANVSCVEGTVTQTPSLSYWFATGDNYAFPNYGGTLQTSGSATGHNVYMGQDTSKYYVCINISGHEVCLSQPYTQYGLEEHVLNYLYTSAEETSAKQAIYQSFTAVGISVDFDNDCDSFDTFAFCRIGDFYCEVDCDGYVACEDYTEDEYLFCKLGPDSIAACGEGDLFNTSNVVYD